MGKQYISIEKWDDIKESISNLNVWFKKDLKKKRKKAKMTEVSVSYRIWSW